MFSDIISTFYDFIDSPEWTTQIGLTAVPFDFKGSIEAKTFARVKVLLPNVKRPGYGENKSVSGLFIVSIFSKEGEGQLWITSYTDNLDRVLQNRTIENNIQLGLSNLESRGLDSFDKTLTRHDYSIPFTYYGGTN